MATFKALRRNGSGFAQVGSGDRIFGHAGVARVPVADAAYAAQALDVYIGFSTLTATRVITLPAASAFPPGQALFVAEESGSCSPSVLITVTAAGSDKIGDPTGLVTSVNLGSPFQKLTFHSNGSNLWTYA